MFGSRRGVSPLIATILLVAFSIGLGALVMSWGEDYITQKAEFAQGVQEATTGCDAVDFSLIKIGGVPQICQTADTVELWIDNGPNIDLYNIHARVAGFNDVYVDEELLEGPLVRENSAKATIPIGNSLGMLLQVKLTPKIYVDHEIVLCSKKALSIENIPVC